MIQILEATTEDLRLAALKLRYDVFFGELGDGRYADHERNIWTDRDDGPQSRIIVAVNEEGAVVGTSRLTCLKDWPFIAHEVYGVAVLAELVGISQEDVRAQIFRWDRGVVAKRFRGLGIYEMLESRTCDYARENKCLIGVAAIAPDVKSHPVLKAVKALGWTDYPVVGSYNGFTAQHIFKDLRTPSEVSSIESGVAPEN